MTQFTRRRFLQTVSLLPLSVSGGALHVPTMQESLLSFSTLGCPGWNMDQILRFAAANAYQGIEIRGIENELDITRSAAFKNAAAIGDVRRKAANHNIQLVNLGSSAAMHHTEADQRRQSLEEAKRYIELASALQCPFVRVFPDKLPKDDTREQVIDLIIEGLQHLGAFAKGSGVTILLESHGDVVYTSDLERIMQQVYEHGVALIWDIANMWLVTGEAPALVFEKLSRYIQHIHIKDAVTDNEGKPDYNVLTGRGIVPLREAVSLLRQSDFRGYYSFEWEKRWHPELADPEIALADFPAVMQDIFQNQPV